MGANVMDIPPALLSASAVKGPSLVYNICMIWWVYTCGCQCQLTFPSICYAYVARYFATSPLSKAEQGYDAEICQILSQLMPFVVDRKSKVVHTNVSSVVIGVWSRFQLYATTVSSLTTYANALLGQTDLCIHAGAPARC
jgi:hypothetical protein